MDTAELVAVANLRRRTRTGEARRIRLESGLALAEIGKTVGVATSTVWRWECGQRAPRGAAAVRYARLLDLLERQAAA